MKVKGIDEYQEFDWGKTSDSYAKYRDIYPAIFYQKIVDLGLCTKGQRVLDLGTGTGVLPRNLYSFGAHFVGVDAALNQINAAKRLSEGKDIEYICSCAEKIDFPKESFDVITACQCFYYFDEKVLLPILHDILKPGGKLVILYMGWLSLESEIAYKTENLILKYNPLWNGCREERHKIAIPEGIKGLFNIKYENVFDLIIPFTREGWHGRMKSCRGVDASMKESDIALWENDHLKMLDKYPRKFEIPHFGAILVLEKE